MIPFVSRLELMTPTCCYRTPPSGPPLRFTPTGTAEAAEATEAAVARGQTPHHVRGCCAGNEAGCPVGSGAGRGCHPVEGTCTYLPTRGTCDLGPQSLPDPTACLGGHGSVPPHSHTKKQTPGPCTLSTLPALSLCGREGAGSHPSSVE